MNKRGLSGIIATVLIILLALAAVVIIWTFINPILEKGGKGITDQSGLVSVVYSIEGVEVAASPPNSLLVLIKRDSGGGSASGVFPVILVEANDGNAESFPQNDLTIEELATNSIIVDLNAIQTADVKSVKVYAGTTDSEGELIISSNPLDTYEFSSVVVECTLNAECDDNNYCNGEDRCINGVCDNGIPPVCAPGETCINYENGYVCDNLCGDLVVDEGEQCDDGNTINGDACSATCQIEGTQKRVFVTTASYGADSFGNDLGSADGECMAYAASLGGTWKAWISNGSESASSRITHSPNGYALVNGVSLALNWADLIDGALTSPINASETGSPVLNEFVWTGTRITGSAQNHCSSWTLNTGNAHVGNTGNATSGWTQILSNCGISAHLYCFEQ